MRTNTAENEEYQNAPQKLLQHVDQFHRGQYQPVKKAEGDASHLRCGVQSVTEKGWQVPAADRSIANFKAAAFFDFVGGNARRSKLGYNQVAVIDDLLQLCFPDLEDDLLSAESALASSAPDINAFGVDDQHPEIMPLHVASQDVESHLVVSGNQHVTVSGWGADGVQPWRNTVARAT